MATIPMKPFSLTFLAFYLACLSCWFLQTSFGMSPVLSAAIVGFLGSFVSVFASVIYAGAFAGMCSHEYLSSHLHIVFISLSGSAIYILSKPYLNGFGGKLGVIAFLSSLLLVFTGGLW